MTVIIKGMKMPKYCDDCPFLDYLHGECIASELMHIPNYDMCKDDNEKPSWCPLEEITDE